LLIINAQNRGTVYGIFYAGIALFGALGAMVAGLIWREFGEDIAISFSMAGLVVVFLIFFIYVRVRDFEV
jgi:Na+/proline symporter